MRFLLAIICLMVACSSFAEPSEHRVTETVKAVRKAMPWVVSIGTEITVPVDDPYIVKRNDYFSTYYFRRRNVKEYSPLGSGIIIHDSGLVLTNWHVARGSSKLILKLYTGESFHGNIIGYDVQSDLCLLKLTGDLDKVKLEPAEFAEADDLLLGEMVLTLGNPFGLEHSVSVGVLSAINRALSVTGEVYNDMIQTDAAINPGNSGGPLINLDGNVIGINQAIRSNAQGIGFAIPAKRLEQFVSRWLMPENFGDINLGVFGKSTEANGVSIEVQPESSAANAGLKTGDIVAKVNGKTVDRILDFSIQLLGLKEGDTIAFTLADGNEVKVELGKINADELIARRLGIHVQKLTKNLNQAMDLPEDLKGLAINEMATAAEYRDDGAPWRQYVKRGDIILRVDETWVANEQELADLLRNKPSGSCVTISFAITGRGVGYHAKAETILLQ